MSKRDKIESLKKEVLELKVSDNIDEFEHHIRIIIGGLFSEDEEKTIVEILNFHRRDSYIMIGDENTPNELELESIKEKIISYLDILIINIEELDFINLQKENVLLKKKLNSQKKDKPKTSNSTFQWIIGILVSIILTLITLMIT